ncbi:MAG TPA: hypothetical protein VM283_10000 [Armatimonadota bacterium]|nr:hypothetical protein [Armatimonadota bacterium]
MQTRDVIRIAMFGALWGALEVSVGTWLHALGLPVAGLIMAPLGVTVALAGRRIIGRNGSVIAIAAVAAALKAVSFGGMVLSPMLAILLQGAIAEAVTFGPARPARWRMALAGALAVCWNVFHPIVGQGILAGRGVYAMYLVVIQRALDLLGMSPAMALAALGGVVAIYLVVGALAGLMADAIAAGALRRLRPEEAPDDC